jgi:hypothetical protein
MELWRRKRVVGRGSIRRYTMRKTIIFTAAASILLSPLAMAQSSDTKNPATTGPAAQSDTMSKGDMSKDKMSMTKKKKSKSAKMKKSDKM